SLETGFTRALETTPNANRICVGLRLSAGKTDEGVSQGDRDKQKFRANSHKEPQLSFIPRSQVTGFLFIAVSRESSFVEYDCPICEKARVQF
ncbi:MAG: hypothetical protein PHW54_00310, partial [Candidatus Omnitrophica bacterium]|nr:hypothetical protein [Candidatus Omnitrophota bacterium]